MNSVTRFHWTGKTCSVIIHASYPDFRAFLENVMSNLQAFFFAQQNAGFSSQVSSLNSRPASDCTLQAGQALTLQARQAGVLHIMQGRVWITFSHADRDHRVPAGDHFLGAGESLRLSAGQAVVMEPWGEGGETLAYFSWEPATATRAMPALALAGWRAARLQPLRLAWLAWDKAAGAVRHLTHPHPGWKASPQKHRQPPAPAVAADAPGPRHLPPRCSPG